MELKNLLGFCVMLVFSCTDIDAGYRPTRRQTGSSPRCERYTGYNGGYNALCKQYVVNEYIFLNTGETIGKNENLPSVFYPMIQDRLSSNCRKYALPILCRFYLPTCYQNSTTKKMVAKPRQFCRDECEILTNLICYGEYLNGRGYQLVEKYANCSKLPAVGTEEHAQCMRIGLTDYKPKVRNKMRNITAVEGSQVLFRCRIDRADTFQWIKNGQNLTRENDGQGVKKNPRIRIHDRYKTGSRLKIKSSKVKDSGYYTCSGSNYGGVAKTGAWLHVRQAGVIPRVTTPAIQTKKPTRKITTSRKTVTDVVNPPDTYGRCEKYTGKLCAEHLGNKTIFVTRSQYMLETGLQKIIEVIQERNLLSERCKKYALPAMCLHMHQACKEDSDEPIPRLCRDDCEILVEDICQTELRLSDQLSYSKAFIPNCSDLPTTGHHLNSYCIPLNIEGRTRGRTTPDPGKQFPSHNSDCYEGKGEHYTGNANTTEDGYPCRDWALDKPELGWSHNFCRNPGGVWRRPWCFVSIGDWEYCNIKSCPLVTYPNAVKQSPTSHTLYVICAIIAVLVFVCIIVITYVKIQNNRGKSKRSTSSSMTMAKGNSSESSESGKQSVSDVKSFILREIQEVTHGKVKFLELMGEGSFGRVFKGAMMNGDDISPDFITIKKIKDCASPNALENFRNEINVVATLQHPNLVCLLGVSAKEGPLFSVFEYAGELNLRQYLQLGSPGFCRDSSRIEYFDESILLEIALQISDGMYYLSENKFIHRDLAARNCYVTDQFTVKISNLGLGSYKYPTDYCLMHGNVLMPVRWVPPEVVTCLKYSVKSDVWSFGVVLWEIFSRAQQPYSGCSNQEVIQRLKTLTVLPCPDNCPARMYSIMKECWEENPADRLHFKDIFVRLRELCGDTEYYRQIIT